MRRVLGGNGAMLLAVWLWSLRLFDSSKWQGLAIPAALLMSWAARQSVATMHLLSNNACFLSLSIACFIALLLQAGLRS